ncbi:efflux RND transporter periplasmic adaptor subunit [cf. Phormidesmis sp. LEGE 11477]|nr:efflux RND transporter periplasmic adaptor subunit [cf. Phormidesmis sp. LEGE 11477]
MIAVPIIQTRSTGTANTEAARSEGILPIETVTAQSVDAYEVSRAYTGEVASLQASELGFERSGQLTELLIPEGTRIQAGEPLARLDVRNLQTQRLQIEAEKARANAQLLELEVGARTEDIAAARFAVQDLEQQTSLQETQLARRQILYDRGAISREELDEYRFGEGSLQARLDQARSNLQELQNGTRPEQISAQEALVQQLDARLADLDVTIAKSTLNAPFSGTVAEHKVDTGTVVGSGQSVVRLVENGRPEARIGIPADVVNSLNIGEERTVELNGEKYTGTISAILPEVDAQTRTQTVVLSLESRAAAQVNPGQTVRLNLTERIETAGIWLPAEALTQGIRGLWSAYVVVPTEESIEAAGEVEYVVQPQSVEVIHEEGDRVLVTGTIRANDEIVASGAHRLVPGQQVSLTNSPSQAFIAD